MHAQVFISRLSAKSGIDTDVVCKNIFLLVNIIAACINFIENRTMSEMDTLSMTLDKLKEEGYTEDFNLLADCIECKGKRLEPGQFVIDKVYRFEGKSDPADESVLYAISSLDNSVKGTLVNGYGIYSDEATTEMIKALS